MKKVGKLNGKVVVVGDKNLITANQIHYEEKDGNITLSERKGGELSSVTGSVSSSDSYQIQFKEPIYYKVDLNYHNSNVPASIFLYAGVSLVCVKDDDKVYKSVPMALMRSINTLISAYGYVCTDNIIDPAITEYVGISGTVKEFIDSSSKGEIIEISKEEFFKVWNEAE